MNMSWRQKVDLARSVQAALASGDSAFDFKAAAAALAADTIESETQYLERDYGRYGPAKRERKP